MKFPATCLCRYLHCKQRAGALAYEVDVYIYVYLYIQNRLGQKLMRRIGNLMEVIDI